MLAGLEAGGGRSGAALDNEEMVFLSVARPGGEPRRLAPKISDADPSSEAEGWIP